VRAKRLLLVGCLACLAGGLSAPGSLAAHRGKPKASYRTGAYAGRVSLPAPAVVAGTIGFVVSRGAITGLDLKVVELCGGTIWVVLGDTPKTLTVPVRATGSFSYDNTVAGDHIKLQGRLKGKRATGTVFDSLNTGTLVCAMAHAAPFTAQH
jgi:hypothetical protein